MYLNIVYNNDNIMFTLLKCKPDLSNRDMKKDHNIYDRKTLNNVTRARNKILDYCYNNDFTYFFTATISSKYDRGDLKAFTRRITQYIRNVRKKYNGDLFYIIVPELHKDMKSWHVHGLLGGDIIDKEIYLNKYNYYSFEPFDNLGFNSLSKISNKEACSVYVTKYITKSVIKSRNKGDHIYLCSNDLNKGVKVASLVVPDDIENKLKFDFSNDFMACKKVFDKYLNVTKSLRKLQNHNNINLFIDDLIKL